MKMLDNSGYQLRATSIADQSALQDQPSHAVLATVARLRAFATLLCLDAALADELVTVTLLRASVAMECSSIDPSLSTWLFSRLRTYYYKEHAIWFNPQALQAAALRLSQRAKNGDVFLALAALTAEEREALVLVEAAGCSLREAARICRYPPVRFKKLLTGVRASFARVLAKQKSELSDKAPIRVVLRTMVFDYAVSANR